MAWLSAIKALFAKPRFIARAAHEMSSAVAPHAGAWIETLVDKRLQ